MRRILTRSAADHLWLSSARLLPFELRQMAGLLGANRPGSAILLLTPAVEARYLATKLADPCRCAFSA